MNEGKEGYAGFIAIRKRLADALERLRAATLALGADERAKALLEARERLLSDTFRILVAGEFKRGKSTLINAFLGREVLPAMVKPCTGAITRVKFAEEPRAILHFKDKQKEPLQIAVEDLKKYIVIDDGPAGNDAAPAQRSSPYELCEVFFPLEMCRNNIEIVDSPGLNEDEARTVITMESLASADAMVLVLGCHQFLSKHEQDFIDEKLQIPNLRYMFVLANHYDGELKDYPNTKSDIERIFQRKVGNKIGAARRFFFVSGREALLGRKSGDAARVAESGVPQFEKELETFLTGERSKVKLGAPWHVAHQAIVDVTTDFIPRKEDMLKQPLEDLRARFEQQQQPLRDAELQRVGILRSIERRREMLIGTVNASYHRLITDLENAIKTTLAGIDVSTWQVIVSRADARKKLSEPLQAELARRVDAWAKGELLRAITEQMQELESDLNERSDQLAETLARIRRALTPNVKLEASANETDELSGFNRVLRAIGGLLMEGVRSAGESATGGWRGIIKGLPINIAIGAGLIIVGFGTPVVVATLAVAGIVRTLLEGQNAVDELRRDIAQKLIDKLRHTTPTVLEKLDAQIRRQFKQILTSADSATKIMIDDVVGKIQSILAERKKSEAFARKELENVKQIRDALRSELNTLDQLRRDAEL